MSEIMAGEAAPAQVGAFLAALRMKGETVDEIAGCPARAMKRSAVQVHPQISRRGARGYCRHGRRQPGQPNISTTSAFVIAGHGAKVAKHGNRAVSSKCGSADVLAALGVNLQLTAEQAAADRGSGHGLSVCPCLPPPPCGMPWARATNWLHARSSTSSAR